MTKELKTVELYVSCSWSLKYPNKWCYILKYNDHIKKVSERRKLEVKKFEFENKPVVSLEILAIKSAISKIKYPVNLKIYTCNKELYNLIKANMVNIDSSHKHIVSVHWEEREKNQYLTMAYKTIGSM